MYRSLVYALALAAVAGASVGRGQNIAISPDSSNAEVGDKVELRDAAFEAAASTSSTPMRTGIMVTSSSSGSAGPLMTLTETSASSTSVRTGIMATNSASGSGGPLMNATTNATSTGVRTGVQTTTGPSAATGTGSSVTPATTAKSDAVQRNDLSAALGLSVVVGGLVVLMT